MSNALAIAAVTAVLKDLLNNGLIDHDVSTHVGPVKVTALPPDRVKINSEESSQLNLFMYQVTPNIGWRNVDLPSRNPRGERINNPPLALDLHYLLTAYGAQEHHTEILLGYGMQILHETPVLGRDAIRKALASPSPINGTILPEPFKTLSASDLADQIEQIKLTLQPQTPEEMSKLWAAFQAHYRPTTAYQASVVLIESQRSRRQPLPVLTVGEADRGVIVLPTLLSPLPMLTAVIPPKKQISAMLDDVITLEGHHLDGSSIKIRFFDPLRKKILQSDPMAGPTATRISVKLADAINPEAPPAPPEPEKNWVAGVYTVAVVLKRPGETTFRTTNELTLSLAPKIVFPVSVTKGADNKVTFGVTCQPEVRPEQRVALIVGNQEIPAKVHPTQTGSLTFEAVFPPEMLEVGTKHLVRLRVDGVESILIDRSKTPPGFDPSQEVTMP